MLYYTEGSVATTPDKQPQKISAFVIKVTSHNSLTLLLNIFAKKIKYIFLWHQK
jgi:hypothetical protein